MVAAATEDEQLARRTDFYVHRAPEELYDLARDPHSLTNLATDPTSRERPDLARQQLLEWMVGTGDPLLGTYRKLLADSAPAEAG